MAKSADEARAKANARGLKAAQAPLSKGNQKLVNQIKGLAGYIAYDRRPTPATVKAEIMKNGKPDGMKGAMAAAKKIAMSETRSNSAPKKISPAQTALNAKIRSGAGITGTGGANVGKVYKPIGGGMGIFGLPKNK
jgi:hypothetical protein